ncbi:hypothetical protein CK203_113271 [Vitis vinifera]|uniref:Uncharacterized protein n=1 Tax=Vitis vinifera TaxID=29760 RepID=A0A438ELK4_VITVI|nr:hypothetical protein CK203_113271 [Vitis vinifera]
MVEKALLFTKNSHLEVEAYSNANEQALYGRSTSSVVPKIPASLCYGCAQECHSGRDVGLEFRPKAARIFKVFRDFNDWELDMVGNLLLALRGHRITMEEDSVFWKEERNGQFSVKKAYSLLVSPIAAVFPKVMFGWIEF